MKPIDTVVLQLYTAYDGYSPTSWRIKLLHPASATGVIVLTSCVCVCVCVLPLCSPNEQTYRPEFLHVGQVEGYLGQV